MSRLSNVARVLSLLIAVAYIAMSAGFFSQDRAGYGVAYLFIAAIWLGTAWIWHKTHEDDKRAERGREDRLEKFETR